MVLPLPELCRSSLLLWRVAAEIRATTNSELTCYPTFGSLSRVCMLCRKVPWAHNRRTVGRLLFILAGVLPLADSITF